MFSLLCGLLFFTLSTALSPIEPFVHTPARPRNGLLEARQGFKENFCPPPAKPCDKIDYCAEVCCNFGTGVGCYFGYYCVKDGCCPIGQDCSPKILTSNTSTTTTISFTTTLTPSPTLEINSITTLTVIITFSTDIMMTCTPTATATVTVTERPWPEANGNGIAMPEHGRYVREKVVDVRSGAVGRRWVASRKGLFGKVVDRVLGLVGRR